MFRRPHGRDREDADLAREIEAHLDLDRQDREQDGSSPAAARQAARREFGNVTRVREAVHEAGRFAKAEVWLKDLRYAARSLARSPGFASLAVLSLALGIGGATAIFTVADQALLRSLPVPDPARLMLLEWRGAFIGGSTRGWQDNFSYPMFRELERALPQALSGVAARYQDQAAVNSDAGAGRASVELVSGDYFSTLGVGAALGRLLTPQDDDDRDGEPWAVLAYDYWRTRFGGDPAVLGSTVRINSYPFTVVGVAQAGFGGFEKLRPADLFVPLQMKAAVTPAWDHRDRRDSIWLNIFARLAPDAGPRQAEAALAPPYLEILRRDLEAHPRSSETAEKYLRDRLELLPAAQGLGETRRFLATPLHILLGMVGLLLLITCVNVANLLIVRASKREKELAVRSSLGASRAGIVRLVLAECLLLSLAGGALGLGFARIGAELLVQMIPADRLGWTIDPAPDWRILAFTGLLAAATALLFGLVPALQSARGAVASSLKNEATALSLGRAQTRLRRLLVAAQMALSLMLLCAAGLFGKSLTKVFETDPGIDVARLLSFSVDPSEQRYEPQRILRFAVELQRRLELLPGAESASAAAAPLLSGAGGENTIKVEGYQSAEGENMQAGANQVLPGFFDALGIPLLAGRDFDERDVRGAPATLIVNETFAKRFFGSPANALGRRVGSFLDQGPLPFEIVGVVGDHKTKDLREEPRPLTYWPVLQQQRPGHLAFYIRTRGDPSQLLSAAQSAVRELDPELAVFRLKTLERQVEQTHYIERIFAQLTAVFATLATLLAALGLYGVSAFAVARRTREIGVRMALGARRGGVFRLVLREALLLAALGVLVGVPFALALGKLVEAQLYGVPALDPDVSLAAVAGLLAVAALASYLPARRAMRISPVRALRYE